MTKTAYNRKVLFALWFRKNKSSSWQGVTQTSGSHGGHNSSTQLISWTVSIKERDRAWIDSNLSTLKVHHQWCSSFNKDTSLKPSQCHLLDNKYWDAWDFRGHCSFKSSYLSPILLNFISYYSYFYFETGSFYIFLPGFEFAPHLLSFFHHSQMVLLKLRTWEGGASVFHVALVYVVREEKGLRYKARG